MHMRVKDDKGFTLIELMIVVVIIGILASLAQPMFKKAVVKAREASLKEDLFNLRNVIDQYYADNSSYPNSLDDLVSKGYMRSIPKDPFTDSNTTWAFDYYTGSETGGEGAGGIFDVHSSSDGVGTNGVPYREW